MATDHDAPRRTVEEELAEEAIVLAVSRKTVQDGAVDVDEVTYAETFELPGADLSEESLTVEVVPIQPNEFTCVRCFIVSHRTRIAEQSKAGPVCADCA